MGLFVKAQSCSGFVAFVASPDPHHQNSPSPPGRNRTIHRKDCDLKNVEGIKTQGITNNPIEPKSCLLSLIPLIRIRITLICLILLNKKTNKPHADKYKDKKVTEYFKILICLLAFDQQLKIKSAKINRSNAAKWRLQN